MHSRMSEPHVGIREESKDWQASQANGSQPVGKQASLAVQLKVCARNPGKKLTGGLQIRNEQPPNIVNMAG